MINGYIVLNTPSTEVYQYYKYHSECTSSLHSLSITNNTGIPHMNYVTIL